MDSINEKSDIELENVLITSQSNVFTTPLAPIKDRATNAIVNNSENTSSPYGEEENENTIPVVTMKTIIVANSPTITLNNRQPIPVPRATTEDLEEENASGANQNSIIPALPSTSRQLFKDAAALHGGTETTNLLQTEQVQLAQLHQQQMQRIRTASSTLDATVSRNPSTAGKHEKKIGHRRVAETGEVTYKRIESKQIMGSIQLGIQHSVGGLASKPKRDLLMNDFWEVETISFPSDGSQMTPAHHFSDFRFKVYAPIAFRYFRDLFGILPGDFLISMGYEPLRELSNPGASGSLFYLSDDDEFIIKTVQKKECEFLQKLLPGYYMNLSQNPRTLLPKFFGLWCFHYNSKNVRLVAMNNLLPSHVKMHEKYDLKGSTFRRKASKTERQKSSPTFKDLDFMERHPDGIYLEADNYKALTSTIQRDCMVLESFQIMDYSLLVGIHNIDIAQKEKMEQDVNMRTRLERAKLERHDEIHEVDEPPDLDQTMSNVGAVGLQAAGTALNRTRSMNRQRLVAHSTAMESIAAEVDSTDEDEDVPAGGIPARGKNNERLILFIGIIDILQSYRLEKKLEHTFKSILYNGETVSVCRPSFYAQRFKNFMANTVFKIAPSFNASPSKRKPSTATQRPAIRTPSHSQTQTTRPNIRSRSSTPPPPFEDISEEDLTANSTTVTADNTRTSTITSRRPSSSQQNMSTSNRSRSRMSSTTEDYSDDDVASGSGMRTSRRPYSPRLSRTNVQVTSVGCVEDVIADKKSPDDTITISATPITSINVDDNVLDKSEISSNKTSTYKTTLVMNNLAR